MPHQLSTSLWSIQITKRQRTGTSTVSLSCASSDDGTVIELAGIPYSIFVTPNYCCSPALSPQNWTFSLQYDYYRSQTNDFRILVEKLDVKNKVITRIFQQLG